MRASALPARRHLLGQGLGLGLALALRPLPAQAQPLDASLQAAITAWAGSARPQTGRVELQIAPLVDNGNAVPVVLRVASPMTEADHVQELVVFNERNPQRDMLRCQVGPANGALNGAAQVSARLRLATSQRLVALARLADGSVWQQQVEVVVTLAACIEA